MTTEHHSVPIEEFFGQVLKFPVSVKNLHPSAPTSKPMMLAPVSEKIK
jgi:hypothetical protein